MKKRIALAVLALLLIFGVLAGIKFLQIQTMMEAGAQAGPQPVTVSDDEVRTGQWRQEIRSVGSFRSIEGTTLRSEAQGVVREILFEPGEAVQKGDVLVRLDTEVQEAQLQAALAGRKLAESNLKRTRQLHENNNISDAELDAAMASFDEATAQVANLKAVIAKRTIRAPFAGRLGIRRISVGQFISPGQEIVSLQDTRRLYLEFDIPQNQLGRLSAEMTIEARVDTFPDRVFTGMLSAMEPEVSRSTRSVTLQAVFDNPEEALRPGMFAEVSALLPQKRAVIYVPQSAILNATYGDTVFVLEDPEDGDGFPVARQKVVRLGEARGDFIEITEGLEGNEKIVGAGAFKLKDGDPVNLSDRGTLEPELSPTPAER